MVPAPDSYLPMPTISFSREVIAGHGAFFAVVCRENSHCRLFASIPFVTRMTLCSTRRKLEPMADEKSAVATSIDDLVKEAIRIKSQIQQLSSQLNNTELGLGASVRISVQRRELEAYLCGILYALGEGEPWP